MEIAPSFNGMSAHKRREVLIADGSLVQEGSCYIFSKDVEFDSPSGACDVVLGRASNGWTEWKDAQGMTTTRKGQVQKADVGVAKNYLSESEITELNRIVTMWLDFAEDQATRRKEVFLKDWAEKLDAFLSFNDRQVLVGAGKVSHKQAVAHAQSEYEQFAAQRRAGLEADGGSYTARICGSGSTDETGFAELGKLASRLTKKKGGRDAA